MKKFKVQRHEDRVRLYALDPMGGPLLLTHEEALALAAFLLVAVNPLPLDYQDLNEESG